MSVLHQNNCTAAQEVTIVTMGQLDDAGQKVRQ